MGAFNMGRGPVGLVHKNARAGVGFGALGSASPAPPYSPGQDSCGSCVPSPACGGGTGRGTQQGSCKLTPSPTLPRKRERERTEIGAAIFFLLHLNYAIDYVSCLC